MTETQETPRPPIAENATAWLSGLFDLLQMDVKVATKESDSSLRINFQGDDANNHLTGDRTHLNAIHGVLQYALFPNERPWKKISLDVGDQTAPSNPALESLADRLANKVTELDKSITIFGMNSKQRKAVHLALEAKNSVNSDSEGNGAFRRIKIRNNS